MKKNLWVLSFEYAGIKKVGGLGEVPANQTKWLSDKYNITLFIPSHGSHLVKKIEDNLKLKKINFDFRLNINASDFNLGEKEEEIHISYYEGNINGVKTILLAGENKFSSRILNDPVVYRPETLSGKFILYSLGMKYYTQKLLSNSSQQLPEIIHCHDHHPLPAMIAIKQQLINYNKNNHNFKEINLEKTKIHDAATIITIHLLTWPRKPLKFLWSCGIEDIPMKIYIGDEQKVLTISELFKFCIENTQIEPTLEKIGIFFADMVTSVSEDYLKSDIISLLGGGWINSKSDFFWNGCDWDYNEIRETIYKQFEEELKITDPKHPFQRETLKKYLLTSGLAKMPPNEPVNDSEIVQTFINKLLRDFPYKSNEEGDYCGHIHSFKDDGPLIMMTGRLSTMKGIDILLNSIPFVLEKHPDTKFVLFMIPSEFSLEELKKYHKIANNYKNSVRIVFGKVFSLFFPLHFAADIYCAPSRWEPFGIIALEAMVSKVPVIASKTGGLQESIIDLNKDMDNGTGLLTPIDNPQLFAKNLINLISIMKIDEKSRNNQENLKEIEEEIKILLSKMDNLLLKEQVIKNNQYGSKIRENCYNRVETTFRWKTISKKVDLVYQKALKNRELLNKQ